MILRKALLATAVLEASDRVERKLLGRPPVFDVDKNHLRPLRYLYTPALTWLQKKLRAPWWAFGPAVALLELAAFPKWRKRDVPLLFAHSTLFALAAQKL